MFTPHRRASIETEILQRAGRDPKFRQDLIDDPRRTLFGELGIAIPKDVEMRVGEDSPNEVHLVLPPVHTAPGSERADAQLEAVAGGAWTEVTGECGSCGVKRCD